MLKTDDIYPILIVDDDEADRELFKEYLTKDARLEYRFHEASTVREAFEKYSALSPKCVILDFLMLGGSDGLAFLMKLSDRGRKDVPVVLVTGYANPELFEDSTLMGASACFSKQAMDWKVFCATVENIVKRQGIAA